MDDNPLQALIGEWEGTGSVSYPTIPTMRFRDQIVVTRAGTSVYHYLQQTWKQTEMVESLSHRETGFLKVDDEGNVEMLGAHGADRVEVLRGQLDRGQDGLTLDLHSVLVAHDPRVLSSWRRIVVSGDSLAYTMGMATTSVPEGEEHLAATLSRSD